MGRGGGGDVQLWQNDQRSLARQEITQDWVRTSFIQTYRFSILVWATYDWVLFHHNMGARQTRFLYHWGLSWNNYLHFKIGFPNVHSEKVIESVIFFRGTYWTRRGSGEEKDSHSAFLKGAIEKCCLENPGIDPGTSRMLSERSTIWANSPTTFIPTFA